MEGLVYVKNYMSICRSLIKTINFFRQIVSSGTDVVNIIRPVLLVHPNSWYLNTDSLQHIFNIILAIWRDCLSCRNSFLCTWLLKTDSAEITDWMKCSQWWMNKWYMGHLQEYHIPGWYRIEHLIERVTFHRNPNSILWLKLYGHIASFHVKFYLCYQHSVKYEIHDEKTPDGGIKWEKILHAERKKQGLEFSMLMPGSAVRQ